MFESVFSWSFETEERHADLSGIALGPESESAGGLMIFPMVVSS